MSARVHPSRVFSSAHHQVEALGRRVDKLSAKAKVAGANGDEDAAEMWTEVHDLACNVKALAVLVESLAGWVNHMDSQPSTTRRGW